MGRNPKHHQPLGASFDSVLTAIAHENKPESITVDAKPFVKWVGGKRSILLELLKRIPEQYDSYHEPFMGGGALYFALQPQEAYLSDINFHLVITYQSVKNDTERLIKLLQKHEANHCKEYYLKMREQMGKEKDSTKLASIFIYINKTCYNGLYRVNKSGGFNVPMGNYKNPAIVDTDNLRNCAKVLKNTLIEQHGFEQAKIYRNDFYYLDPPYHETFSNYSNNGFDDDMHAKLADYCKQIDKVGAYFMLSNSDTPFVRELYKGYTIETVSASRFVSCKSHQRGKENELIIRNYQ